MALPTTNDAFIFGASGHARVVADAMEKQGDGLLHTKDGMPLLASAGVSLTQGVLEGSNVNAFVAMTEMIELARNFELQTKVMKNVDENAGASAKLMQLA